MTSTPDDCANMSNEEFTMAMLPTQGDMTVAAAWLAAQAQMDPKGMLAIYTDAAERGRLFQLMTAIAETTVRATRLRDDPGALPALLADLLKAAGQSGTEGDRNDH